MKKILLLAVISILALPGTLWGQNQSTIVLFEFSSTEGKSEEARNLFDAFRVRLINSRAFGILEGSKVTALLVGNKILPGTRLAGEKAADLGRQLKADYALIGHYTAEGTKTLLRMELMYCPTGKSLLAKDFETKGQSLDSNEFDAFTAKVLDQKTVVESTTLLDVEALMKAGKYPEALSALKGYNEIHAPSEKAADLEKQITKKLGEIAFTDANRLLGKLLFDETLLKMNEAIFYDKDNQTYTKFLDTVRQKQAAFGQTKKADAKSSMDKLLAEERWDSAQMLLNALSQRKILDAEVLEYQDKVNKGKLETETYQLALKEFWSRRYASALNSTNEIIIMNPSKGAYQELKQKILAAQKDLGAETAQWEAYRSSWENVDWFSLVGQKKLPPGFDQGLAFQWGTYRFTDKNDLNKSFTMDSLGFDLRAQWQFVLPFSIPVEFVEFQYLFEGGLSGSWATKDSQTTFTDPVTLVAGPLIDKALVYDAQVYAGAGLEVLAFSFGFSLHTGPFNGVFSRNSMIRNVVQNSDSWNNEVIYDFGWYVNPAITWSLDKNFRISMLWVNRFFLVQSLGGIGGLSTSGFQLGARYTFF